MYPSWLLASNALIGLVGNSNNRFSKPSTRSLASNALIGLVGNPPGAFVLPAIPPSLPMR